ncbi:MAG: class E sortase [Dethiobacteria bacterium]|jgi:sortase A|nr:class E sortase [Bacillota bacterium]
MKTKFKNQKKIIRSWTGALLIISGILIIILPFAHNTYLRHSNARDAQQMIDELSTAAPNPLEAAETTLEEEEPEELLPAPGILVIPAIDLITVVNYGVEEEDLKKGPGFYPQSGYPDHSNVSIAAHRGVYGAPFRHVDKLQEGDELFLYYRGKKYIYEFTERFITHSRDWSVIEPTPEPALTLTTCPLTDYEERRMIIRSTLIDVVELNAHIGYNY